MTITRAIAGTLFLLILAACAGSQKGPGGRGGAPREIPSERKAELMGRFLVRWDHDRDGSVTCDDVAFERGKLFTLLDTDGDDLLVSGEYRYAQFEDKSFMFHLFTDVDADSSGTVSRDELTGVVHSQFAGLDRDGDCFVSEEEMLTAARERMRERRRQEGGEGRGQGRGRGQRPPGGLTDTASD